MKIFNYKEPFYHTIIYDYYNIEEEKLIWQEIDFLNQPGKLFPPHETGDPNASSNKLGIILDDLYHHDDFRKISNILTLNRKVFSIIKQLEENIFSNYIKMSNLDLTFLSYYSDGAYYKSHFDESVVSAITTFWRTPKEFTGGDLIFDNHNYVPKMNHNSMIIFPSFEIHSVSPVKMNFNSTNGRYTINQFFKFKR